LIAYFLGNFFAKNCGNRTVYVKIIASCKGGTIFETQRRTNTKLECGPMLWANAQRDGHPAEYGWRPLFNAAVWLTPTTRMPCSNAAKTPPVEICRGAPN